MCHLPEIGSGINPHQSIAQAQLVILRIIITSCGFEMPRLAAAQCGKELLPVLVGTELL